MHLIGFLAQTLSCLMEEKKYFKSSLLQLEKIWKSIQDKYFWAENMREGTMPFQKSSAGDAAQ